MKANVPFIIPAQASYPMGRPFAGMMQVLSKLMPGLGRNLALLDMKKDEAEYLGAAFVNALFAGVVFGVFFYLVAMKMEVAEEVSTYGSAAVGAVLFLVTMLYITLFPAWIVRRRADEIEENLLYAMRHVMVQTSAGVPFFESLSTASSGYGAVSAEFRKIMNDVNGGRDLTEALEESAAKSPSKYYKGVMWHISNSTRSGYDVGNILKELVGYLSYEQQVKVKKFGSELNVISMFYLSTCVLVPTMGLILAVILSSFSIIALSPTLLGVFVFVIAIFNMVFLGMIQSRRPKGLG
jgi:flagellar protein FlaJ